MILHYLRQIRRSRLYSQISSEESSIPISSFTALEDKKERLRYEEEGGMRCDAEDLQVVKVMGQESSCSGGLWKFKFLTQLLILF